MLIANTPNTNRHPDPYPDRLTVLLSDVLYRHQPQQEMSDADRANTDETIARAYKAWKQVYAPEGWYPQAVALMNNITPRAEMLTNVASILGTGFPMADGTHDSGIVTQGPIRVQSLCPHHLLPVEMDVYVAYQPVTRGTVLGLSKLARLAQELGRRPVLQEQYTADVANALHFNAEMDENNPLPQIASQGSAVQAIGRHSCMACRGVRSSALTLTTILRGSFRTSGLCDEFYQAIEVIQRSLPRFEFSAPNPYLLTPVEGGAAVPPDIGD